VDIASIGDLEASDVDIRIIAACVFIYLGSDIAAAFIFSPNCFCEFEPNPKS
jgi:hypothetical protein